MDDYRFALSLLLSLRANGVEEVHTRAFHAAFSDAAEVFAAEIEAFLGHDLIPHPLFDVYPCVEGAFNKALRAGIVSWLTPDYCTLVFNVQPASAAKLALGDGLPAAVVERFLATYAARPRREGRRG